MTSSSKFSILFIVHEDSLTGAPILLLNLLDCLEDSPDISYRIVIKNLRGKLIGEFRKRGKTLFVNDFSKPKNILNRILQFLPIRILLKKIRILKIQNWLNHSSIVFLNTITLGDIFKIFRFQGHQKIISYIHELEFASSQFTSSLNRETQIKRSNKILVPCKAVGDYYIEDHSISPDQIRLLPYYIPFGLKEGSNIRVNQQGHFRIGMMGSLDWRKGADLLPQLLFSFFSKFPGLPVEFLWKGVQADSLFLKQIRIELKKLGLEGKMIFEPQNSETDAFFKNIDLFLSLSREDPYPLVVLEAARYKIPSLCFEKSGGAPEFVEPDAGAAVPFLNLNILSEKIFGYFNNENLRKEMGERAYSKWEEIHGNPSKIKTSFLSILENL